MKKISTLYRCTGRSFTNYTQKQRQLLRPLNNLKKRILQKERELKSAVAKTQFLFAVNKTKPKMFSLPRGFLTNAMYKHIEPTK